MLAAYRQNRLVVRSFFDLVLLVILLEERLHVFALRAVARDVAAPVFTQQLGQAFLIGGFRTQRFDERLRGLFRRWKFLLCRRDARPGQANSDRQGMHKQAPACLYSRMVIQRRPPLERAGGLDGRLIWWPAAREALGR
ncbi:hypothetical protein D9M71_682250 [compost metagenome]